jgi:2-methylisocitrate lyase-like PEP mutase family enzyme
MVHLPLLPGHGRMKTRSTFRYHSSIMTPNPLTPAQKASRLLQLHHAAQPLVLINAWDAASAAMIEHCGLPAIATSSAAMANALGFPDGQYLPWAQMLEAVASVCRAVKVPVTADIESGFAANVTALETSITQIIQAGAVGVNLEDVMSANPAFKHADSNQADANIRHGSPLFPLPEQIARIQATRRAAQAAGIHLVINARTDAYWQAGVSPAEALRGTLERGKAYLHAGADCIFVPGLRNPEHIKTVIDHLSAGYVRPAALPAADLPSKDSRTNDLRTADLRSNDLLNNDLATDRPRDVHRVAPVNILAGPGVPSIPELAKLGVKRISYGSGPHRAAMGLLRRMADEAKTSGTFKALTDGAVPYEEINGLFKG